MAAKVSPFMNKAPFPTTLQSTDIKVAAAMIKDLNTNQRSVSKKLTLMKVLTKLNASNK